MIDIQTNEGRIVSAALRLAGERPWQDVTLRDIGEAAGINLAELSELFSSKSEILGRFVRLVDREVLASSPAPQPGESARDGLFEVIMARLDALEPYKAALKSIAGSGESELSMVRPMLSSQGWMLQAAGIDSEGPVGAVRTAGLASVYASVFRVWLDDDDPGLARTMAVLDRRLRSGESVMSGIDGAVGIARRVKSTLMSGFSSRRGSQSEPHDDDVVDNDVGGAGEAGSNAQA